MGRSGDMGRSPGGMHLQGSPRVRRRPPRDGASGPAGPSPLPGHSGPCRGQRTRQLEGIPREARSQRALRKGALCRPKMGTGASQCLRVQVPFPLERPWQGYRGKLRTGEGRLGALRVHPVLPASGGTTRLPRRMASLPLIPSTLCHSLCNPTPAQPPLPTQPHLLTLPPLPSPWHALCLPHLSPGPLQCPQSRT